MRERPLKTSVRVLIFLIEVFQPVFWIIRFLFRIINPVLFSWWAVPLFERWDRKLFAEDIRQAIPSLFNFYGASVVPDPEPKRNDSSMDYVCISCAALVFKFRRWRRENYGVEVAPTFAPTEFLELANVLQALDPTAKTDALMADSWHFWGTLLEPRFQMLELAFSPERFEDTKDRISKWEREERFRR